MASKRNPAWAELVQLVPVISLAFPFIVAGKVDLARAGTGFVIGAILTVPIVGLLIARKHILNPILVGTGLWLWLGAVAFSANLSGVVNWLVHTQAVGLFVAALLVGMVAHVVSPYGYVACASPDRRWIKRASLGLLGLTVVIVAWSWLFRHDIRLGGGLPFITLNVVRRVLVRRAPRGD
jgi:hypothetical protein